jgi:hypothetical protein
MVYGFGFTTLMEINRDSTNHMGMMMGSYIGLTCFLRQNMRIWPAILGIARSVTAMMGGLAWGNCPKMAERLSLVNYVLKKTSRIMVKTHMPKIGYMCNESRTSSHIIHPYAIWYKCEYIFLKPRICRKIILADASVHIHLGSRSVWKPKEYKLWYT